jgi:acetyltransferase-like isoleucine patch superfamily enzyme
MIAQGILNVDTVNIPDQFSAASDLVQHAFPTLNVKEFYDDSYINNDDNGRTSKNSKTGATTDAATTVPSCSRIDISLDKHNDSSNKVEIPINSLIHLYSHPTNSSFLSAGLSTHGNNPMHNVATSNNTMVVDVIRYPWEFLKAVQNILQNEVTHTIISPIASIASTSIIEGPCIIEDGVKIDDFCKIIGPAYIGSGSVIGMSCLIRNSMLCINTNIGFSCEIARTYFEGHDKMAHQNVILDSLIGKNVWFGGYSGTANVLLDKKNVKYQIGDRLVDTGEWRFGVVVGNNCAIGADVIILPGRQVSSNSVIQAGTVVGKKKSRRRLLPAHSFL